MKTKTKRIFSAVVFFIAITTAYCAYNYWGNHQEFMQIRRHSIGGNVNRTLHLMDSIAGFSNPIVNYKFQKLKKKYKNRFILKSESNEKISSSNIANDISSIYKDYWKREFIKQNNEDKTDSVLYKEICNYLIRNSLTKLSYDSLNKNIKNDSLLKKIIEQAGMNCEFFFINGFRDILIWDKQIKEEYTIQLPNDTLNVEVVFIENYIIGGHLDYATFGEFQIGGWASETSLYCNKGTYDLSSEEFDVSYLKHEANHFIDLQKYPELSSADLEYRSKLVELIYCDNTIYDRLKGFIREASPENRDYAHSYASYILILNLSKVLFDKEFETDIKTWESISPKEINEIARDLLQISDSKLNEFSTKVI